MTKELKEAITSIQRLNPFPGWLDRNIEEAKKSLPPTEEQIAAAFLAGKIEGLNEALQVAMKGEHIINITLAIRAKIAELKEVK